MSYETFVNRVINLRHDGATWPEVREELGFDGPNQKAFRSWRRSPEGREIGCGPYEVPASQASGLVGRTSTV